MYSLIFLLLLYSTPIFFTIESLFRTTHSTQGYVVYLILVTGGVCLVSLVRAINSGLLIRVRALVFLWLAIFIMLGFWLTQYRYGSSEPSYMKAFLFMGVQVIPAIIIACFSKEEDVKQWQTGIIFLDLLFTVSVWYCIIQSGGIGLYNQAYNSEINTYASLGYYMTYAYSFTLVLIINCRCVTWRKLFFKIGMMCIIPLQLLAIFSLGGKAPMLICVLVTIVVIMFCSRQVQIGCSVAAVLGGIISIPYLMNLSSIKRLLNIAGDMSTIERVILWTDAIEAGIERPILGNGIGSEFYVLDFRTHNIFTDVFVEYGMIGPIFVMSILLIVGGKLFSIARVNKEYLVLVVMYINSVLSLMVSGYYLADPVVWGICVYVLVNKRRKLCMQRER